jgi:hypothetical protein
METKKPKKTKKNKAEPKEKKSKKDTSTKVALREEKVAKLGELLEASDLSVLENYKMPTLDLALPSTFFEDMVKMQDMLNVAFTQYADTFERLGNIGRIYTEQMELAYKPLTQVAEVLNSYQSSIANINNIVSNVMENSALKSGILSISNMLKSYQIEAFAGVVISSEITESISSLTNGITNVSRVKEARLMAGGRVRVDVGKETTSLVTAQAVFHRVDSIDTRLQFVNEDLTTTKDDVQLIKQEVAKYGGMVEMLMQNPFHLFKIVSAKYNTSSSHFVINGQIQVPIKSKTFMDYVCQVLFSGKKEATAEWYWDEIKEHIGYIAGEAEAEAITWKKMQGYISDINTAIAKKTTKDNIILIPRQEIVQLNPFYFSPQ